MSALPGGGASLKSTFARPDSEANSYELTDSLVAVISPAFRVLFTKVARQLVQAVGRLFR